MQRTEKVVLTLTGSEVSLNSIISTSDNHAGFKNGALSKILDITTL